MYFKVNYNIHGKQFDCMVSADDENRFWTVVYINPSNPKNDCWIRRESGSPSLFKFKTDITKQEFDSVIEQVYLTCKYN